MPSREAAGRRIPLEPLTAAAFAPFGEVIEPAGPSVVINGGAATRYPALATLVADGEGASPVIGIVRADRAATVPHRVPLIERHPLGSQAFVPLDGAGWLVIVAPAELARPDPGDVRAFLARDGQGVNYRRGLWHAPLPSLRAGALFLVADRAGPGDNLEVVEFAAPPLVVA